MKKMFASLSASGQMSARAGAAPAHTFSDVPLGPGLLARLAEPLPALPPGLAALRASANPSHVRTDGVPARLAPREPAARRHRLMHPATSAQGNRAPARDAAAAAHGNNGDVGNRGDGALAHHAAAGRNPYHAATGRNPNHAAAHDNPGHAGATGGALNITARLYTLPGLEQSAVEGVAHSVPVRRRGPLLALQSFARRVLRAFGLSQALDYSAVTSAAQADALSNNGQLARVWLLPKALGGAESEANAAYVPPSVAALQQQLTATLERYLREGRIDDLSIDPEYKGKSLVPARIRVKATHSGRVGVFTTVIGIW